MNLLSVFIAYIEWYETAICISFANVIVENFFPNYNASNQFKIYLILSCVTFISKPIGAYLFGKYSDNYERLKAARLSFLIMMTCISIQVILLPFSVLGVCSQIIIFLVKIMEGIAIGGNYSTSIYSIESSKNKYFVSSLTSVSIFFAFLIANTYNALCISYCTKFFLLNYSWRLGLFLTFIFSLPVFYLIRKEEKIKNLKVSDEKFEIIKNQQAPKCNKVKQSILITYLNFKNNQKINIIWNFIKSCALVLLDVIPFQYFHCFLPNYKIMVIGYSQISVRIGTLITLTTIACLTPVIGYFADKWKPELFLEASAIMMIISFFFKFFKTKSVLYSFHLIDIYFGIMMSLCYATLYCYMPLKFNTNERAKLSGVALHIPTSLILILTPIFSNSIEKYINTILCLVGIICLCILFNEKERY